MSRGEGSDAAGGVNLGMAGGDPFTVDPNSSATGRTCVLGAGAAKW